MLLSKALFHSAAVAALMSAFARRTGEMCSTWPVVMIAVALASVLLCFVAPSIRRGKFRQAQGISL